MGLEALRRGVPLDVEDSVAHERVGLELLLGAAR